MSSGTNPRIVNLTGHPITLTDGMTRLARLESEGRARVHHIDVLREYVDVDGLSVPVIDRKGQEVYGLPDSEDGVLYVVSGIVQVVTERKDVVAPGQFLRRRDNSIRGARAFVRVEKE